MKKILFVFLFVIGSVFVSGCSKDEKLSIDIYYQGKVLKENTIFHIGDFVDFQPYFSNYIENISSDYKWYSDNQKIAKQTGISHFTFLEAGTVNIYFEYGDLIAKRTVKVEPILVDKIYYEIDRTKLAVGETIKVNTSVDPKTAHYKTLSFSSSNENVATIDNLGTISALSVGQTLITISAHNKGYGTTSELFSITVLDKIYPESIEASSQNVILDKSFSIPVSLSPVYSTEKKITYTIENEDIVTYNASNNSFFAKNLGRTNITITTANNLSKTITVEVSQIMLENFDISAENCSRFLNVGDTCQFYVVLARPYNATTSNIIWEVSHPEYVTIDQNGLFRVTNLPPKIEHIFVKAYANGIVGNDVFSIRSVLVKSKQDS